MQSYVFSKILKLPTPESIFGSMLEKDEYAEQVNKEISKLHEKLNKSYSQISEDEYLLCTIYKKMSDEDKDGLGAAADIKKAIKEVKKWREEMEEAFYKYANSGWGSGKTIEEMFNELFDPFLAALDPLNSIISQMGLQEIPILNIIPRIINDFSGLGRIVSRMPKEVKEEARKQAKEAKEAEEALKKAEFEAINEKKGGNRTWNYLVYTYNDDSLLKKVIDEIVECFKALFELIKTLCSCAEIFVILLILDKFKPIIDQFKIVLGDAITMLENIETVLKLLIQGEYAMIKFFGKLLWSKVEDIYNILMYICSGRDLPSNALISGCWMDIVSANCDISATLLSLDMLNANLDYSTDLKSLTRYRNLVDDTEGTIKEMYSSTPLEIESIKFQQEQLSAYKKKKEYLELSSIPLDRKRIIDTYRDSYFFDKNKEKYYAAELEQMTSQDTYLNPTANENEENGPIEDS